MRTNELISDLSRDYSPVKTIDRMSIFLAKWCLGSVFFAFVFIWILPMRADLQSSDFANFMSIGFWAEETLWFGLMLTSATVVYRSRIPGLDFTKHKLLGFAILSTLVVTVLLRTSGSWTSFETITAEITDEISFYRGRCGILILMTGLAWGAALMFFTAKGAPTRPAMTGGWIAVSAGSLIALVMPLVCAHENSLHVLFWHCVPVAMLSFLGAVAGQKWLRW